MNVAARPYFAAAAALTAGSMIALTSPASLDPGTQARPFALASLGSDLGSLDALAPLAGIVGPIFADPLLNLQAQEISSNAALSTAEFAYNSGLLAREEASLPLITSALPGLTDPVVLDHLSDANNLVVGTAENLLNSVLGAGNIDSAAINSSLLDAGPAASMVGGGDPFLSGQVGGLQGVTGNYLVAFNLAMGGLMTMDVVALGNAFQAFDQTLIGDEFAFNSHLLQEELLAEQAAFGGNDSALNGAVDRLINIENLPLSTEENALNSLIGADYDSNLPPAFEGMTLPEAVTASLLTGVGGTATDPTSVFDTGYLGGLEGIADQNSALLADLAGLDSAGLSTTLAELGNFNATEFTAAVSNLFDISEFANLAPDLSAISGDLGTVSTDIGTALLSSF